ncbi:MAG TPA: ABC transporter permease [Terracidiphilus sp.]|nr:ABC transporter permease [Terracidiphilus sp.]
MRAELKELHKYRELLFMITYRDIKVRYKQSVMGFMWAVLMPILIVMSGVVVRYVYALASHVPLRAADIASVAVKSLPWAFLVSSIRFSCSSLTNNTSLVTKIYFPKEIFPIAAVLASLFDFLVASCALTIFLVVARVGAGLNLLWIPILLLTMILFAVGVGMIVAAASLFFRDVKFIVEVFLTFGIFFTPVFYDVRMLGEKGKWLLLNPISPLLEAFSATIARQQSPDLPWLTYSLSFALASSLVGYFFFKHLEPTFAESI